MTDESFTLKLERTAEFCDRFIDLGLHEKINWIVHSRVEVTKDILVKMREANCTHITYGLESGNQDILDRNVKKITLEKSLYAVRWAREAGLVTDGNFILGLPYENTKTIWDTIKFAVRCNPDYASFFLFVPYPGTRGMELARAGEANLRLLSTKWADYGKQVGAAVELKTVSRKKMEIFQFLGYLLFYMRPGKIVPVFKKVDLKTVLRYLWMQLRAALKTGSGRASETTDMEVADLS